MNGIVYVGGSFYFVITPNGNNTLQQPSELGRL